MLSFKSTATIIDEVGTEFRALWGTLRAMKNGPRAAGEILGFQSRLARAIARLDRHRTELCQARRRLVALKGRQPGEGLVRRLRANARKTEALEEAAKVGRSLGDSFAWFFLQNDRDQLRKHLEHMPTNQIPSGLGGDAELHFVETVKSINRCLVLYHGITNFLRIGDFSLVSLRDARVSGIGEIKISAVSNEKVELLVHIVSPRPSDGPTPAAEHRLRHPSATTALPPRFQPRLRRQVEQMTKALAKEPATGALQAEGRFYYEELRDVLRALSRRPTEYRRCGDSLLLVGHRPRRARFSSRLLGRQEPNIGRAFKDMAEHALPVCDPASHPGCSDVTSIPIGLLTNHVALGLVPLFWWPIGADLLEPVVFHDVVVSTVFNPAGLVQRLREEGFTVRPRDSGRRFSVSASIGRATLQFEGVGWFFALTPYFLFKEDSVVDMMKSIVEKARAENPGRNVKIMLNLVQCFGPLPGVPPVE